MPAAGMAGLIKTALALHHRILPPTLYAEKPHPLLDRPESAFALNSTARPWIHPEEDTPRRAGVNSFGFSGTSAHAVLEEHADSADQAMPGALLRWPTEAILLSAPDRALLIEQVRWLMNWLAQNEGESALSDVAYSLNRAHDRQVGGARLGLVASSLADLAQRLAALLPRLADATCRFIRDGRGVYYWDEPLLRAGGRMAFLFPGEGSQYPGMLADLCFHFPEVRREFDTADRIALALGEAVPPSAHLFGQVPEGDLNLWSATLAVDVVLNSQWALYQLLTRLGLYPDAVVGHSSGELLALAAAGTLEADRALEQKLARLGAIFREFESSGDLPAARLVAVATDRDRVRAICRDLDAAGVAIAMDNCPHQVVLAVPHPEAERVAARLRQENILFEELPFSRAYHTASFGSVLRPVADFFAQLTLHPPKVPVYSCAVRGAMPTDTSSIQELAVAQWTQTVAFRDTIETMYADGLRLFVDVGARGNLAAFVEDILRGKPSCGIAAGLPRRNGLTQLNHLVATAFAQGAQLDPGYLYARRRPRAIDWNQAKKPPGPSVEVKIGFPEMRLSERLIARLRAGSQPSAVEPSGHPHLVTERDPLLGNGRADYRERNAEPGAPLEADLAVLSFQETMRAFLKTQEEVTAAYLAQGDRPLARPRGLALGDNGDGRGHAQVCESTLSFGAEARGPPSEGTRHGTCGSLNLGEDASVPSTSGGAPGPWAGEIRRLIAGAEVETVFMLDSRDDPIAENHTLGGRKVSAIDPSLKGLPVLPFAVMAEMTAQVGALVVRPGLRLTGLRQARAHKWLRYEEEPIFAWSSAGAGCPRPAVSASGWASSTAARTVKPMLRDRYSRRLLSLMNSPPLRHRRLIGNWTSLVPAASRPRRVMPNSGCFTAHPFRHSFAWEVSPARGSRAVCACCRGSRS
jgi:malonyl CoA-acyl carrier protein transacylase